MVDDEVGGEVKLISFHLPLQVLLHQLILI